MDSLSKEDYNNIPVFYCEKCLSLKIRDASHPELMYCDDCSCTSIKETSIEEWDKLYREKYGFHYLEHKKTMY